MILKSNWLVFGLLLASLPYIIDANLTTLQSWDPAPFFNAANLNMPPDTVFCYAIKNKQLHENTDKKYLLGINVSPFVQKAIRAQQSDDVYFGMVGQSKSIPNPISGFAMSDYQGTPYLMGLFLGQDIHGNSIWGGPSAQDTGVVTDITTTTVHNCKSMPQNLQNAVIALNNCPADPKITDPTDYADAILFNNITNSDNTSPSILSQSVLEQDKFYFGAFSVPLEYQKAGFRWEINFDFSDQIGFIARGGFCQITQRVTPAVELSDQLTQLNGSPGIYTLLNTVANSKTTPRPILGGTGSRGIPVAQAQSTLDEWVTNNINDLLDPTNGANYDITTFSQAGIEDLQLLAFFRHPFYLNATDPKKHASIFVTPYAMIGGTIPIAPVRNYSKLYSLPFGNNGHASLGGVAGVTFDFMESIEFGFEFGATGFFSTTIDGLPCPNHELQRVIYPYRQNVTYSPGFNGQFAAIFNAYHFMHNTTFSCKYNYVQHSTDTITLLTPSQYFFPSQLEELSPWSSQMLTSAITFDLQSNILLSIAWQAALSQKNAYCSNTILGTLSFLF